MVGDTPRDSPKPAVGSVAGGPAGPAEPAVARSMAAELFGPGVGAAAGPPTRPARATQVPPGAHSHGGSRRSGSAADRFTSTDPDAFGVPTGREEDWRFTPLARLRPLLDPLPGGGDGKVVVDVQAAAGVEVRHLAGDDPLVGSVLVPPDRVSALALRHVGQALAVVVPAGRIVSAPTLLSVRGESGPAYGHLIVDVGPRAEAVVVIDHLGSTMLAANLELRVADGGALTVVSLQNWADDAVHVETQAALVGRDARLRHVVVTLGGGLVRLAPTVRFAGPGGDAELLGLSFADAGQHLEHRLYIDHEVPHCRSRVTYKSALQGGGAHTVWIGDVRIRPAAVQTDTYELNRNLLLTDGARADSVPNLEIETGEVLGAGHASATGRFDDAQLFYLMSRGIPADEARRLVVRGFFADLIGRIGLPEVEQQVMVAIDAELAGVAE